MSIDCPQLDGDGYAFTLTIRDIPPTADAYTAAIKRFMQRLREEEFLRWHRVIELTKRRRPHLHGSVYFPEGWTPSGSPISDNVGAWTVATWLRLAAEYGAEPWCQKSVAIDGARGWLEYLSKHSSRTATHYQRRGKPAGWESTGRVWRYGGEWPRGVPLRVHLEEGSKTFIGSGDWSAR